MQPGAMPVVKLQRGQFTFTNKAGTKIDVDKPIFELIGWTTAALWEDQNQMEAKDTPKTAVREDRVDPPVVVDNYGPGGDPLDHTDPLAAMGVSMPAGKRNF